MNIELEQVFYGRGERGYGVLGASPGGQRFAARVEALCGGVGTPDGGYGGEPFLISVPEGEWVVMVCGRRGGADSIGRGTLFFHALVGKGAELEAAGADAFSLFAQGAFAERMPEGGVERLQVDVQRGGGRAADGGATTFPAAIRSERPLAEAVRSLAGSRANALRWATCAFQPMPGFDIQVLPPRTALPRGTNEYDANGRLVRAAAGGGAAKSGVADGAGTGGTREVAMPENTVSVAEKPRRGLLALSLALNALLAVVCAVLWATRSGGGAEIARHAVERYRAELAAEFPAGGQIRDWDEESSQALVHWYDDIMNYHPDAKRFLARAKTYVDFVNNHILDNTKTKENNP